MREAHSSLIAGHIGVRKTISHLHRYLYWPCMVDSVSRFIRGVGNVVIDGKGDAKGGALETETRQREHET